MSNLLYGDEAFAIIGKCMDVHRILGHGFLESVYKDALEYELDRAQIPFLREEPFEIPYKDTILKRKYYAYFTVMDKIILEAKALDGLPTELTSRAINYLKVSGYQLCLLVNFGRPNFEFKRIVL